MSHKKKLYEFVANIPGAVYGSTTNSLQQLKSVVHQPEGGKRQPENIVGSNEVIKSNHLEEGQSGQNKVLDDGGQLGESQLQNSSHAAEGHHDVNKESLEHSHSDTKNFNINSVLTQRSQVEDAGTKRPTRLKKKKHKLEDIEIEKKRIQEELKQLDDQIKHLKQEPAQPNQNSQINTYKKHLEISQDSKAYDNAQKLVEKLHMEKKAYQQKKQREQRERLEQMERQTKQKELQRQQKLERLKKQRRETIAKRIEEDHKKREERRLIDQQSNALIKQIRKEQASKPKPISTSLQVRQLEAKKKLLEKKRKFDIDEIEEHQRRYKQLKELHMIHKSEEARPNASVPKYPKGKFLEQLEQQQKRHKEQERLKQEERRTQIEKRLKYGQLVKKIFLPPKAKKTMSIEEAQMFKPPTPDVVVNGPVKHQVTRKTYTNSHDIINRHNTKTQLPQLMKVPSTMSRGQSMKAQKVVIQQDPAILQQRARAQRQKIERERQIRKQTKERLKHVEELQQQRKRVELPKVKKYQNYLEKLPRHQQKPQDWKKIIQDQKLSKQQKYKELMSKAAQMENKAKFMEQMGNGGSDNPNAMNLIIGSIQAKLALLDKF